MENDIPILLEPNELANILDRPDLIIVDLSHISSYTRAHVPGALHVLNLHTQKGTPPAPGLLAGPEQLSLLCQEIGLTPNHHVVAYDDEGGGWAGRFLWMLDVIGHHKYSYLNGGIHSWLHDEMPTETTTNTCEPSSYQVSADYGKALITIDELLERYDDDNVVLWDARSREEFDGVRAFAPKAGHIPNAIHYEWIRPMDRSRQLRIRDLGVLREELANFGITSDKEVITYCHTHHRSAYTWLVGKLLGFPNIRGYAGSWSEWGNHPEAPVNKEFKNV